MKLLSLEFKNFKGFKKFKLNTEGNNINIYGDNATGKTTIADGFNWLLFDKDTNNRSDFNIKPLDETGRVKNNGAETIVSAEIESNARKMKLEKRYKEKWTKKRGRPEAEFDGNTTDYFINDVPSRKRDYDNYINEICTFDLFRILTDVLYFCETMDWKDRRDTLFKISDNKVTDDDILTNDKFEPLLNAMDNHKLDDFKTILTARRKNINKELNDIPVRISELANIEETNINISSENKSIEKLNKELEPLETKKQELLNGFGGLAVKNKIFEFENKLEKLEIENSKFRQKQSQETLDKLNAGKNEVQEEIEKLKESISFESFELNARKKTISIETEKLEKLRKEYKKISLLKWDKDGETCPTCKQSLPSSDIEKAISRFNENKSIILESNVTEGRNGNDLLETLELESNKISNEVAEHKEALNVVQEELDDLTAKSLAIEIKDLESYESEKEDYQKEMENLKEELSNQLVNQQGAITDVDTEILVVKTNINEHQKNILSSEQQGKTKLRIKELEDSRNKFIEELDKSEHLLFLIDEFTVKKISLVEEHINNMFKLTKFKLFDVLVNGSVNEICEATYDGIPFKDLNNAMKINVGLDVISTLSDVYKFEAPIFIDNAESVTNLIGSKSQLIRLVVSENDKELRVEIV